MTVQLLGKDDSSFDDSEVSTGRWQAYIDSFVAVRAGAFHLYAVLMSLTDGDNGGPAPSPCEAAFLAQVSSAYDISTRAWLTPVS